MPEARFVQDFRYLMKGQEPLMYISLRQVWDYKKECNIIDVDSLPPTLPACIDLAVEYLRERNMEFFIWSQENTL